MGISRVMVVMVVIVIMPVVMVMMVVPRVAFQSAHAGAERVTQGTIRHIRSRGRCPLSFDMVVMAFLDRTHFGFKSQNLDPVFAHDTGLWRRLCQSRVGGGTVIHVDVRMPIFAG